MYRRTLPAVSEQNGGLAVFGYPITAARQEVEPQYRATYLTQWFERNRFGLHSENTAPYDVPLGRLGDDRLVQTGRDWRQEGRESGPRADCLWFEQTGHTVCNQDGGLGFRQYVGKATDYKTRNSTHTSDPWHCSACR